MASAGLKLRTRPSAEYGSWLYPDIVPGAQETIDDLPRITDQSALVRCQHSSSDVEIR